MIDKITKIYTLTIQSLYVDSYVHEHLQGMFTTIQNLSAYRDWTVLQQIFFSVWMFYNFFCIFTMMTFFTPENQKEDDV